MSATEKGRYCERCNKTVIDYTRFTDARLFEYINSQKNIPCGRFYPYQLDYVIHPPSKKKSERNWFTRIAASVIAFLSFHSVNASVQKNSPGITVLPGQKTNHNDTLPGKIIISGMVADEYGKKLEKANVIFNGNKIAETNNEGYYEFELNNLPNKSYLLQFSYPELVIASRSFHPFMGSTRYDIALAEPHRHTAMGGAPVITFLNFADTTISFNLNDKTLEYGSDSLIAELANQMRYNPHANITITGEVRSNKEIATCKKMAMLIQKKLIDEEGIAPERIIIIKDPIGKQKRNLIRIESVKQEQP